MRVNPGNRFAGPLRFAVATKAIADADIAVVLEAHREIVKYRYLGA